MISTSSIHESGIPESGLVGTLCLNSDLCQPIRSALEDAGIWAVPIQSIIIAKKGNVEPILIIICADSITPDLLATVAQAATPPDQRILIVTHDRDPQHIADVLRCGADDYLTAPFAPEEFIARIRSILARSLLYVGYRRLSRIAFDLSTRTIFAGTMRVSLTDQEWNVLLAILEADGEPVSVTKLSESVPNHSSAGAIIVTLSRLRRKLKETNFQAISIETIRGKGYRARLHIGEDPDTYLKAEARREST